MTEIRRILASCSAWELDALRQMGMKIPVGIVPREVPKIDRGAVERSRQRRAYHERWRGKDPERYAAYLERKRTAVRKRAA